MKYSVSEMLCSTFVHLKHRTVEEIRTATFKCKTKRSTGHEQAFLSVYINVKTEQTDERKQTALHGTPRHCKTSELCSGQKLKSTFLIRHNRKTTWHKAMHTGTTA